MALSDQTPGFFQLQSRRRAHDTTAIWRAEVGGVGLGEGPSVENVGKDVEDDQEPRNDKDGVDERVFEVGGGMTQPVVERMVLMMVKPSLMSGDHTSGC